MVHIPVRGELPARLGPSVQAVPGYGPSVMDAHVYRDPTRYELERERVLGRHWMLAGRSAQVKDAGDWITYALGIPAAEAELGSDTEYRDFFVPKSVKGARKIIEENMEWVQYTYEKLGN